MSKLFNEELGIASNSTELARLKKKFKQYDSTYVAISTMINRPEFREWLESAWKQYKPFADSNFLNEFKKRFNQRAWELYLGVTLLNRGYLLESHSNTGPDFKILHKNKNIWIEATAVEKGDGLDKVPDIEYGKEMDVPEEEMLLRLSGGLSKKYLIYLSYLEKRIIGNNDPFVIAIDRSDLEHFDAQIPLILSCLFGIGHQVLSIKRGATPEKAVTNTWSVRNKVNKSSGSEVEMGMFNDSRHKGISAVIYNNFNVLNSPKDLKHIGDSLVIVDNPYAKNPLPDNFFKFGEVWKKEGDQLRKFKT